MATGKFWATSVWTVDSEGYYAQIETKDVTVMEVGVMGDKTITADL
jgi:hypothetical protein